jgi:hypothetical protein
MKKETTADFEIEIRHVIDVELSGLNETGLLKVLYYVIGLAEGMTDD